MKDTGATHVSIEHHPDHDEYEIEGWKIQSIEEV